METNSKDVQRLVSSASQGGEGEPSPAFGKALGEVLRREPVQRSPVARWYFSNENQRLVKAPHAELMGRNEDGSSRFVASAAEREALRAMSLERRRWTPAERLCYPVPAEARNSLEGALLWQVTEFVQDHAGKLLLCVLIWSAVLWPGAFWTLLKGLWRLVGSF